MIAALILMTAQATELPSADSRALDPAAASAIVEPLAKCVRRRIAAHRVEPAQRGREDSARNFATWQMSLCGAGDVQARLIAAMRAADRDLSSDEALGRAGALLGTVLSEAAMQASRHFRVAPVRFSLIQCPHKSKPQPEACKEPPAPPVAPIDVPYQAMEQFGAYRRCVLDRFDAAFPSVRNIDAARKAHFDSVAACRDVRAVQLARALERVTDRRIYGSRAKAQAMARLAFDRFDREFDMEWDPQPPPPQTNSPERAN